MSEGGIGDAWQIAPGRGRKPRYDQATREAIRRGSFVSVPDSKQAIEDFTHAWNNNHKPFIWTASVGQIAEKIDRARTKMEQIKPGSTQPRAKKQAASL